jgi:hypothetical protein
MTGALEAEATARARLRAVHLRLAYWSYDKISQELSVPTTTVRRWVHDMMPEVVPTDDLELLRTRDAEALDGLTRGYHQLLVQMERVNETRVDSDEPLLYGADEFAKVGAQLVRVQERRAKLLGLDKPVLVTHTHKIRTEFDQELESLVSELAGGGHVVTLPDEIDEEVAG